MSRIAKEGLLSRWSRLKRDSARDDGSADAMPVDNEAGAVPAEAGDEQFSAEKQEANNDESANALPSLDELEPDSDFQGFMKPGVDDDLRRAALKKLFGDPHFNVTDGLDVYAEDYTKLESMTPAMVAGLKHAQRVLFGNADEDQAADEDQQADAAVASRSRKSSEHDDQQESEQKTAQAAQPENSKLEEQNVALEDASRTEAMDTDAGLNLRTTKIDRKA